MRGQSNHSSRFISQFGNLLPSHTIGEVAEVYDGTHQTPNYVNEGIRFVSVEDINDLYNSTKFISEADYQKYKHVPTVGDIIMTRIGSIGKCAIVDREEPLAYYVSVSLLKLNHEMIDSRYLKYYLESDFGDKELKLRSLLKAFPMKINLKEIPQVRLILPEIAEQIKFVDVVKQADKSKFTNFKSRFIEMTSVWNKHGVIRDLVDDSIVRASKRFSQSDNIQYIDISSVDSESNHVTSTTKYQLSEAPSRAQQCTEYGDILVSTVRPNLKNIAVNQLIGDNLVASTGFCVLRPKAGYHGLLLAYVLSDSFTKKMVAEAKGSNYPAIHDSDVLGYPITIPDKSGLEKADRFIKQADKSKYLS